MVMDGGGRGTVALPTSKQSGPTPFLVKYPHLESFRQVGRDKFGKGKPETTFKHIYGNKNQVFIENVAVMWIVAKLP